MYPIGTYVVYGTHGPCRIHDITHLDMPGCDRKRKYYVLEPAGSSGSIIYSPVDSEKVSIREVISREAAAELLDRILEIEPLEIHEEKFREEIYREVMRQSDCTGLLGMIRTLLRRREIRLAEGRKFTSVDERFLNEAMNRLSCELAIAMNETQEQAEQRLLAALQAAPV